MTRLAALLTLLAAPAAAQTLCLPRADMVAQLSGKYGESVRAMGSANSGEAVVEVWGRDGGSWTITVTGPNGVTCLLAAGQDFAMVIGEAL